MGRHPTLGFEIWAPTEGMSRVVVGDLFHAVNDLSHAPEPLRSIKEVISAPNYALAARRYLDDLDSAGVNSKTIVQLMNEPTAFRHISVEGSWAVLPPGTALRPKSPPQELICAAALQLARRGGIEGFELRGASVGYPRLLVLEESIADAIIEIDAHYFTPAHFLPHAWGDLFEIGA
jgi:hypothetical protein